MSPQKPVRIAVLTLLGLAAVVLLAIGWSLRNHERSLVVAHATVYGMHGSKAAVHFDYQFESNRPGVSVEGGGSLEMAIDVPAGMETPAAGETVAVYFPPGEAHAARFEPPSTQLANGLLIAGALALVIATAGIVVRRRTTV